MKNHGTEVISAEARAYEQIRRITQSIDLTFVFNRHADTEDAENTVSSIEPDSVVFIEGFSVVEGTTPFFKKELETLSWTRIHYGKDSLEYISFKHAILDEINTLIMIPVANEMDFTQNVLREIQLLLEKDCFVQYADYCHVESSDERVIAYNNGFSEAARHTTNESAHGIIDDNSTNIAKTIRSLYKHSKSNFVQHYYRELMARAELAYFFIDMNRNNSDKHGINMTGEGKFKTYVTYGSAHSESLMRKFQEFGYTYTSININEVPEQRLIEKTPTEFRANQARRIAFHALDYISGFSIPVTLKKKEDSQLYENLDALNDSPDDTLKFLIRCIQIARTYSAEPDRAVRWADDLRGEVLSLSSRPDDNH